MERYAWKARLRDGRFDEYVKRHNEIWPQLKEVLREAGIINYSIWTKGPDIFGYYECAQGAEYAAAVQAQSPVVDQWNEFMKEVMVMEMDPVTGAQPKMEEVFYLP